MLKKKGIESFSSIKRLKPYSLNTEPRKKASDFENNFFKLINSEVFGKTTENVKKHRDIKLEQPTQKGIIWYQNQTTI